MPYKIRKVRNKPCYSVTNLVNKKKVSKCTTMKKAKKQLRLLYSLDYQKSKGGNTKTKKLRK